MVYNGHPEADHGFYASAPIERLESMLTVIVRFFRIHVHRFMRRPDGTAVALEGPSQARTSGEGGSSARAPPRTLESWLERRARLPLSLPLRRGQIGNRRIRRLRWHAGSC